MKTRLFSILLSICMVVTMIPVAATAVYAASKMPTSVRVDGLNMLERPYYSNSDSRHYGDKWNYDAVYDSGSNTLTLAKDARIDGVITVNYTQNGDKNNMPLTVRFEGNNTLYNKSSNGNIAVGAGLIITGEGTLNAECHSNMAEGSIYAEGNITIDSVNITAVQDKAAAPVIKAVGGDITISGAGTTVNLTNNSNNMLTDGTRKYVPYAVEADGDITVSGGAVLTASQTAESDVQAIVGTVNTDETGTIIAGKTEEAAAAVSADVFNANSSSYKYVKVKTVAPHNNHCICGASHQAVGDHTDEALVEFTAWDDTAASKQFGSWSNKTGTNALPESKGNYYLTDNVYLEDTWNPQDGVVVCLNGYNVYTVDGKTYQFDLDNYGREQANALIRIRWGAVTLTNCKEEGTISNNSNSEKFKGIYIANNDKSPALNMYGVTVTGFLDSGIYLAGVNAKFNMYGGKITGNTAVNGGGVKFDGGFFNMYGGAITGNTATENGGGVYGKLTVGGNVTITGNFKGTGSNSVPNNVYLPTDSSWCIDIIDSADSKARIGVTAATPLTKDEDEAVIARIRGWDTTITDVSPFKDCFISDTDSQHIKTVVEARSINFKYFSKPQQSGFEYGEKTVEKTYGDPKFTNRTLTGVTEGGDKITYSSSNPEVAAVDEQSGEVTIAGAGSTTITATVPETENYGKTEAKYTLNVAGKKITAPEEGNKTYVYTGQQQTYEFGTAGDADYYNVTGNIRTDANENGYTVTVSLKDKKNTVWADSNTAEDKTYSFVINRKQIEAPAADTSSYTYNGAEQIYGISDTEYYTVSGNVQTNAGTHDVTVSLTDNYKWSDGNTDAKIYKFVIKKAVVDLFDFKDAVYDFTYTGKEIIPELVGDKSKVDITGDISAKDVKTGNNEFYVITVSLKDINNYRWNTNADFPDWTQPEVYNWRILPADKIKITAEDRNAYAGDAVPENNYTVEGLLGEDSLGGEAVYKYRLINEDGTVSEELLDEPDMSKAGKYEICISGIEAPAGDNYKGIEFTTGTLTITKKSSGTYKPTQKPEITAGEGVKAELRINGTKATITVEEGYEITDVLVNGVSIGKVTEITGLKTGDKVEIKTAKKQTEPEFNVKNHVKELKLTARSSKTAKGNIRVKVASVTDQNGNTVDLSELQAKGYTVKYKFYRSEKKASEYSARLEKDTDDNSYINNIGEKGTKYFYKVRVMVYDANGKLVAKSELAQCRYATRTWSK